MKYVVTVLFLIATSFSVAAGTHNTIDFRQFMTPIAAAKNDEHAQVHEFMKPFMLQHDVADALFASGNQTITVTNVPLPPGATGTLKLELCRPVFDANTQFVVATKQGKVPLKVRPIFSYKGVVDGQPGSKASIHYCQGELTGFITHTDGSRTVVGRAPEYRAQHEATPHVFQSEAVAALPAALASFLCGADELPFDEKDAVTSMLMPSSVKNGESSQNLQLKELKLALVLREDVDSALGAQGLNEEQVAQHFAKIVASMSQVYEEEVGAHMYIGYLEMFTMEEPSGFFYDGASPGDLLDEFSQVWSSGYDNVDRTVAHLYTIKRAVQGMYVGGIAYGGQAGSRLCVTDHRGAYGVSTLDLRANTQIPGAAADRNAFVWDVFVAAHEIGHNVGAPHTHNCFWSPPVDTCQLQGDNTDACYSDPSLRRVRPGTIMSYCHLVNGSSTPLTFGTRVAERMRTWVDASCMKPVTAPTVRITEPRGPENWAGGATMTIKWVSAAVSMVNLEYSLTGSGDWTPIASGLNAADKTYAWVLPTINTTNLWIRISDASNAEVNNVSLAAYTIRVPLSVSQPIGGERIGKGTTFQIRWSKDNSVGNVNVYFSPDNGSNWEQIAANQSGTTFDWTVPSIETEQARIRVSAATNSSVDDVSEVFAIGTPRFELLLPMEGADLCNNFDNQYRWSGDFIERIRIQYSTDGGTTWRNALQPLTVPLNQWEIFSRSSNLGQIAAGTKVQLRVSNVANDQVLATRNELTVKECTQVTSVNEGISANGFAIAAVTPNPASSDVTVLINHAEGSVLDIDVVDASGSSNTLIQGIVVSGSGTTSLNVPVESLPSGAYQLVVRGGDRSASTTLRIVR